MQSWIHTAQLRVVLYSYFKILIGWYLYSDIIYTQLVTQKKSLSLSLEIGSALKFLITFFCRIRKSGWKKNHFTYGWNLKEIWSNMRIYIYSNSWVRIRNQRGMNGNSRVISLIFNIRSKLPDGCTNSTIAPTGIVSKFQFFGF